MTAFYISLAMVFLAEMGDKTQLLAMAFATRFRWQTVLWGVLAATLVNHLLAAYAGSIITDVIPLRYVHSIASLSFILFSFWIMRGGDTLKRDDARPRVNPFWTIAPAFFLAEIGDKTQLATMALAAEFTTVIPVWLGTTTGMVLADAAGILAGTVLHKKIPEAKVKWLTALVFIAFGAWGLYRAMVSGQQA